MGEATILFIGLVLLALGWGALLIAVLHGKLP
jgi:hypothetical protein